MIRFLNPRRARRLMFAAALTPLLFGCSQYDDTPGYNLEPEFSLNIGTIDEGWPVDFESLGAAKREALQRFGRPDFFHIIWSPGHDVVDESTIHRIRRQAREQAKSKQSASREPGFGWIYLDRKEEVVFLSPSRYVLKPLSDKLQLLTEMGDPQRIRRVRVSRGKYVEEWTYYNQGMIFQFDGGMLISEDRDSIPAQPNYLIR